MVRSLPAVGGAHAGTKRGIRGHHLAEDHVGLEQADSHPPEHEIEPAADTYGDRHIGLLACA